MFYLQISAPYMTLRRRSTIQVQTELRSESFCRVCHPDSLATPSQCIGRVPDVTAPTARYPYEVTLHQGEIENMFLDSMRKEGLEVERPIVPISLQISEDPEELSDPHAHPIKVRRFPTRLKLHSFTHTHIGRAKALRQR